MITNRACRRSTLWTRRSSPCPRSVLAAEFATPARWRALWPDLDLEVVTDRGAAGFRWTVTGALVGSMEVWLEPVLDGTVLHYFLRAESARRPPARAAAGGGGGAAAAAGGQGDRVRLQGPPGGGPGGGGAARPVASSIMRVHVVSDVHGHAEALARAGDGADALVVLGDLVDFVDYADPARGILGRVFGPEVSARFGQLRAAGKPGELRAFIREAWSRFDDPAAVVDEAVREQYAALFAAMTTPTYAIPGNVDVAALWPEFARPGVCQADGQVVTIGGLRFGFVGGIPLPAGHGAVPGRRVDAVRARRPRTTPPPSSGSASSTSCAATPRPRCPSWPTTWSRGVRRRRRRRCSPASAATAPGRPCSGTSTSRWRSVAGWDAPSASTSATSARRPRRTSCAGDRR